MFSKSKTKRFVDIVSDTPAVGQYDIQGIKDGKAISFNKANRWNSSQEDGSGLCNDSLVSGSFNFSIPRIPGGKAQSTATKKKVAHNSSNPRKVCRSLEKQLKIGGEDENDFLHNKIANLENEIRELKAFCLAEQNEKKKLEGLLDEALKAKTNLELQKNQLVDQKELTSGESAKYKIEDMEEMIDLLLEKFSMKIKEFMDKYGYYEKTFGQAFEVFSNRITKLSAQVKILKKHSLDEAECLKETNRVMEVKYDTLNSDYQEGKKMLVDMEEKLAEYKGEVNLLESKVKSKDNDCQCLQKELDDEIIKSKDMKEKENILRSKLEMKGEEIMEKYGFLNNDLDESSQVIAKRLANLNAKVAILSKHSLEEVERWKTNFGSVEAKYKILNSEYAESRNVLLEQEEKLAKFKEDVDLLESEVKAKEDACQCLQKKLTDAIDANAEIHEIQLKEKETVSRLTAELERAKYMKPEDLCEIGMKLAETQKESDSWKERYEELERKVAPFLDQLNRFEFEKQSLLNENALSQKEMEKLSEKYGYLLGHQNNKQKIRHVVKLKQENFVLKTELRKFQMAERKIGTHSSKRDSKSSKFGLSKASHNGKENEREPLKGVNS